MNADGTGRTQLTSGFGDEGGLRWSPDGRWLSYRKSYTFWEPPFCDATTAQPDDFFVLELETGVSRELSNRLLVSDWTPDSTRYLMRSEQGDLFTASAPLAFDLEQLTNTPSVNEFGGTWSPDNTRIAYNIDPPRDRLIVANADGTGATQIATGASGASWQPLQRPYARPAAAGPVHVPLVTAFEPCTAANREHGPPLAFPSCSPPLPASPNLIVSAGEAYQSSTGFVRLKPIVGTTGQPDDADVLLRLRITNVMNASDRSDYTGVLRPELTVRLTDRDGFQHQTTQDFPFGFDVPCAATASTTVGGLCELATTADAVVPGSVPEGTRAIWQLGAVQVRDGEGDVFVRQGIFVP